MTQIYQIMDLCHCCLCPEALKNIPMTMRTHLDGIKMCNNFQHGTYLLYTRIAQLFSAMLSGYITVMHSNYYYVPL